MAMCHSFIHFYPSVQIYKVPSLNLLDPYHIPLVLYRKIPSYAGHEGQSPAPGGCLGPGTKGSMDVYRLRKLVRILLIAK